MWRVLAEWARMATPGSDFLARSLKTEFRPAQPSTLEGHMMHKEPPVKLQSSGWILGQPLTKQADVLPVVTFEASGSKGEVRDAAFRVGLFRALDGGRVAEGWRFEQGEPERDGEIGAHPYAHAQAIKGWRKDINCLIHSPHADGDECSGVMDAADDVLTAERQRAQAATLVKHPAFPLGVVTLTGLALAVFTTLYGAIKAREAFGEFHPLKASTDDLREDLVRLSILTR